MHASSFRLPLTIALLVCSASLVQAQNKVILYNTNSYPVWVSTGIYSSGPTALTGGKDGVSEIRSKGWTMIKANDAAQVSQTDAQYLYVRTYSYDSKSWQQIRPAKQNGAMSLFIKKDDFQEAFYLNDSLKKIVSNKGGELRDFYPIANYREGTKYELRGPNMNAGAPPKLVNAVAMATFTNKTDSRVFFKITTGNNVKESSLGKNESAKFTIEPNVSSIAVTQSNGTAKTFSLPRGANYQFAVKNGVIENQFAP